MEERINTGPMDPMSEDLDAAMAQMVAVAVDGKVRYHGSRKVKEKHFSLRHKQGATVRIPFLVAMKGAEATRLLIEQQVHTHGPGTDMP